MTDRLKLKECFFHFRHLYRTLEKKLGGAGGNSLLDKSGKNRKQKE